MTAMTAPPVLASPCLGICEIDGPSGFCRGCGRTAEEVAQWRDAGDRFRAAVWRQLPERLASLGVRLRRLSWGPAEVLDFTELSLREARGTWALGVFGAVGRILLDRARPPTIKRAGSTIEAATTGGALRLTVTPSTRALANEAGGPRCILLVLPRVRLAEAGPAALTSLGPDAGAIAPSERDAQRFDIGLGRAAARFTVRTRSPALVKVLSASAGRRFPDHLAATGAAVLAESPARVVETALGRVEVTTPFPPDGKTPEAPHTHLHPALLARGLDLPPEVGLPPAFAVGAIFYP